MLTEAERSAILETEIRRHVGAGYRLVYRTPTTAQLIRPKVFDVGLAVLGLLFLLVGLLIYLLVYIGQSDESLYLSIEENGWVRWQGNGRYVAAPSQGDGWVCQQCGRINVESRNSCKRCRTPRS